MLRFRPPVFSELCLVYCQHWLDVPPTAFRLRPYSSFVADV